ncbi:MAG TPA: hypothetical protein VNA16_11415 [Abditibacteriaceae bacterium]|nr:hypothetical protein [Abditibacteriaceae bacterium]
MPAENTASDTEFEKSPDPIQAESEVVAASPSRPSDLPLFWLICLLVMGLIAPFIPVPNQAFALVGAVVLTASYVLAVVLFVAHLTRLKIAPTKLLVGAVVGVAAWAVLQFVIAPAVFGPIFANMRATQARPAGNDLMMMIGLRTLTDLVLLCTAVCAGGLVARLVRTPNMLGPVCAAIVMIDIWGVLFGGIVSQLITHPTTAETSQKAMAAVPTVGAMTGAAARYSIPQFTIGVGDYLFLGLLFAVLHLNNMNWRGAVWLTIPLTILTLLATEIVGHMPGLLPIGLGVALPNLKYFKYTREENFALLYAGLFVILLTIGLYFGVTSMLPDKPPRPS